MINEHISIDQYIWKCENEHNSLNEYMMSKYDIQSSLNAYWPTLNIQSAIELFVYHIHNKNKIIVFGDYDVDGICGSVIISKFLNFYNANYEIIIPNRFINGYGLNMNFIESLENVNLLITIDNGSTAINEIALARSKNIDVIIIDHHTLKHEIPNANFIINPKLWNIKYIYDLCGTGITFVFLVEVLKYYKKNNMPLFTELYDLLDLVAVATVCDVVSLQYLNRSLVANGLKLIRSFKSYWSQLLLENISEINAKTLGFNVGPYINAAGRFGNSNVAYEFLYTNNRATQISLLAKLFTYNENRKTIENEIMNNIYESLHTNTHNVYINVLKDCPEGILGILAARIKDIVNKPVILFTNVNNDCYKSSARSYEYFHIGKCIQAAEHLIITGGGHQMAGGLTIHSKNYDKFCNFVYEYYEKHNDIHNYKYKTFVAYISLQALESVYNDICQFEPFGVGFERPIFCFSNVNIQFIKYINNKHALFSVFDDLYMYKTTFIVFNIARTKFMPMINIKKCHIIGHIQKYQKNYNIEFISCILIV